MSEKRLSDKMTAAICLVDYAADKLAVATKQAINLHFDAGVIFEQERIIKLPFIHEGWGGKHRDDCVTCHNIELIKGENK